MKEARKNGHARIRRLTRAEAQTIFDRAARRSLGMSGAEFRRRWQAGEFRDPDGDPRLMEVAMLLPLGR